MLHRLRGRYGQKPVPHSTPAERLAMQEWAEDVREIADLHVAEMGTSEFLVWPGSLVRGFAIWRRP